MDLLNDKGQNSVLSYLGKLETDTDLTQCLKANCRGLVCLFVCFFDKTCPVSCSELLLDQINTNCLLLPQTLYLLHQSLWQSVPQGQYDTILVSCLPLVLLIKSAHVSKAA